MYKTNLGTLYLGDAGEILPQLNGGEFHLIFTDPPYPKKFEYTYDILAEHSARLLMTGGSLITIIPHYNLPKILSKYKSPLKWRWLLHVNQFDGPHARMLMGIEVTYKVMGWWVKEKYRADKVKDFTKDGIRIEPMDREIKKQNKWQQSLQWCEYYIKKTTNEGDLVLDPFIGYGTIAVACEKLNRRWVGIEIDESVYDKAVYRIFCERTKKNV